MVKFVWFINFSDCKQYVVRCMIWYHLYNLKNMKNTHRGVLILVKVQAEACKFTKITTPPWAFFTFLKLYKWHQIAHSTRNTLLCTQCEKRSITVLTLTRVKGRGEDMEGKIMHWWFFQDNTKHNSYALETFQG